MIVDIPIYEPPVQPKQMQNASISVRWVVFHQDGKRSLSFDGLYKSNDTPHKEFTYGIVGTAEIVIPVDPITAINVLGCTPAQMGFSDAEQALLNLLKR